VRKLLSFLDRFVGGVTIRPAGTADFEECAEMALASFAEQQKRPPTEAREALLDHFAGMAGQPQAICLVAEGRRGRLAGMVCCEAMPPDPWGGGLCIGMWLFCVRPEYRSRPRVALGLMRGALDFALLHGAEAIRVLLDATNEAMVDGYVRRLGFHQEAVFGCYRLKIER